MIQIARAHVLSAHEPILRVLSHMQALFILSSSDAELKLEFVDEANSSSSYLFLMIPLTPQHHLVLLSSSVR